MKNIIYILVWMVAILGCKDSNHNLESKNYDQDTRIYTGNITLVDDQTIQEIIQFSGIRSEGYGVIIFDESYINKATADSVAYKFMKRDINSVHQYKLADLNNERKKLITTACAKAKFTWIVLPPEKWDDPKLNQIKQFISLPAKRPGIVILNKELKNTMSN